MDGAFMGAHFFVPPCHWANQGGELKLTLFFPFFNLGWFSFWEVFFFSPPCLPKSHLPTYL